MTGLPMVVPERGLPEHVTICEVGPRDGLQAEQARLNTGIKIELIRRLLAAGLHLVEATSFVSPRWVPQLGDAAEVLAGIDLSGTARHPVLVPNEHGMRRALEAGAKEIAVFASATEGFARRNLGRGADEVLAALAPVVAEGRQRGMVVRGYISMCFGDPWEGAVPVHRVVEAARRLVDQGCTRIALGDTIGVATPGHVTALVEALDAAGIAPSVLALHCHDTYGQALANVHAGLQAGVREFDSSVGGTGGCPFARSATGNLATEDLVWMLHGLGYDTGVDLAAVVRTGTWLARHLGRPNPSRVAAALSREGDRSGSAE
ncbi:MULTISPECIES: hydroxymethylglutaryl-CoA lyase [unclassified Saccharopolyspora]|uniref:hydroxymethylglutaryl-CoA lyase n=1 Tax=unclassified Saccharopolyspora TaxID=2646250 RepID=UPI001CD2D9FB|nr:MULTISPECIES: hydroxymethylglutaryl-CoA lyase [unclassified Saccharopolyspora]MCA1189693.1 hydroxymethylglutaryl-CoA lyase [Saccharopolyspora sp. 6T]MCA1192621.1 hydroxymethylglutaryl-CoA lyase [Saccharopolyspora sp. 6V]MCA1226664.1 hydroxymethylglutaryl-CoA lyase [Saccharopolyspora sp. 6M]MCA1278959.1 hydroxymethylglutaryl-CoA lyase [Saccharopolyspora sp. 7B]